jgi:hypothetical protein
MMTTPPASLERRAGQRFTFNLPIALRDHASAAEGLGVTQDVSSRGAFFFTDMPFSTGAEIQLTLKMPSEITLGEAMRVRCKGRILRVVSPLERAADRETRSENGIGLNESGRPENGPAEVKPVATMSQETRPAENRSAETKIGVAVCFTGYEYLPEMEDASADFRRISALHGTNINEDERPAVLPDSIPRGAIH